MEKIPWDGLYHILDKITPLAADCGKLCQKRCCSLREEGQGVYLFPGEEVLFPGGEDWYTIKEYGPGAGHFTGDRGLMLNCAGSCPRERRPLACRLLPLAPYMDSEGNLNIILDSDALFICPIVRAGDINLLETSFREGAARIWGELIRSSVIREGVRCYSARLDSQNSDPWTRLLGG
ncbi:MAG: hypothetical protein JL50_16910 [Peptococcaceae bacterium BICA1-7]|nr:MAG: hypothetical protein JL50_16910 [Peptococcaceae bacterium BICA1-7]HBV96526.1 hypothetical protein [Desulfotomaculum sp.]